MVALGGIIGLIIVIFGVSAFSTGLKPGTLALIGLPVSAAMHSVQDAQAVREERLYEMNQRPNTLYGDTISDIEVFYYEMNQQPDTLYGDTVSDIEVFYYENPNESDSYATEAYYDTLACPDSELYQGTWRYTRITQNGIDLEYEQVRLVTTLSENDTMQLNSNRFRYDIKSLNKHSNGIFGTIELHNRCAFNFMYLAPDGETVEQIRTFEIDYIDQDSLCISEGPLVFEYRKK